MNRLLCVIVLLCTSACGGGSAEVLPPEFQAQLDIGIVSATGGTAFTIAITNPNATDAALTAARPGSPAVRVLDGELPAPIPPQSTIEVRGAFTPSTAGPFDETLTFDYSAPDGEMYAFDVHVVGIVEGAALTATPMAHDFGDVLPGTQATRVVTLSNDSQASRVIVTGVTVPAPAFEITGSPFPLDLEPGATADVTLRYTGGAPGAPTGPVTFQSNAEVAPSVAVQATTGGEEIVDLGTPDFGTMDLSQAAQNLVGASGVTDALTFDVPADAIGFTIEATASAGTSVGLGLLTGPGGEEYENEDLDGAYFWSLGNPFIAQVPSTDNGNLQPVAGGGTYTVRLLRVGNASECTARVIVERRPATGTSLIGTIDLNVFLANAIAPTAATAESDTTLQTVLDTVDDIYAPQGIRIGQKSYYDVTDTAYDDVTSGEFGPMLELSSAASEVRLNLFFVRTALGDVSPSILGVSPTLFGPKANGTDLSGVMSEYPASDPEFIGLVAAHEIGHFLGLSHTREQNGSYDDITDTTEYTSGGGGYLMHWRALGDTDISDGQALVVRAHPHVGPALLPPPTLTQKPQLPPRRITLEDVNAPQDWCATCRRSHAHKQRAHGHK